MLLEGIVHCEGLDDQIPHVIAFELELLLLRVATPLVIPAGAREVDATLSV